MVGLLKKIAKRMGKDAVLGKKLPDAYLAAAAEPVRPGKVLFVSATSLEPPSSYDLIMPRLEQEAGMEVEFVSLRKGSVSWSDYVENCVRYVESAATAQLIFLDDASDVTSCLPLRPETRAIQLWHACGAFKKWGMATVGLEHGEDAGEIRRHPGYENLSLVSVSSPEVVWAYAEAMDLKGREDIIKPLGVSRTDVFFDESYRANARRKLTEHFPAADGKRVVLYAPTFRGTALGAKAPDELDIALLNEALGDGCTLAIRHHPFVKERPAIPQGCRRFAFDAGDAGMGINELMCAADMLVTDYSSVVFEYSLLGRPMAFFAPDIDDYGDWRGFFYPYEEMTPGPVVKTTADLSLTIARFLADFNPSEVDAFRARFMGACDGHSTDRILSAALSL